MLDQKKTNKQSILDDLDDFKVGKGLPYQVPEDFFDSISEKTLELAKKRFVKQKRTLWLQRTVTVLSIAAALLAFVFLPPLRDRLSGSKMVAQYKDLPAEKMEDVLQDLSDDELAQLQATYRVDDVNEIITQESVNLY